MDKITLIILQIVTPCVNFTVMLITLPRRWKLGYTLLAFAAVLLFIRFPVNTLFTSLGTTGVFRSVLNGFVYLPFLLVLIRGQLFQKIFAYFMQMTLSAFQLLLVSGIAAILFPVGSDGYALFSFIALLVMYIGYITLMFIYGRRFVKKLFVDERPVVWGVYSFGAALSFLVVVVTSVIEQAPVYFFCMFFAVWSFCILCFAIINTHEKSKQRYEAELARSIVSSGREHYQKMDEMYTRLRIQRHDYKYHLTAISELLAADNKDDINRYMTEVQTQFSENEMGLYCTNNVINALLSGYAERCAKLGIEYTVEVMLPEQLPVPNYEMCIVLGNLLENAVEACQKLTHNKGIQLLLKPVGGEFALRVRNSFDGRVFEDEGRLKSVKKDGGFGLKSVEAVAIHYGGELITDWTDDTFTAYVTVRL